MRATRSRRVLRLAAVTAVGGLALTGCGFKGLYGVQLPGGAPHGPSYKLSAVFDNVTDLVPQSAVKVNDVTVGSVSKISLTPDLKARVDMKVEKDVVLPANAVAILQQTSLLGEKFVQLAVPQGDPPKGRLHDGDTINNGNTTAYPDVEQVFGVLSSILNGGGLQKMQTISFELSKAMAGREGRVKDFLLQLTTFVHGLDVQKQEIVRAIDALDRLSGTLVNQKQDLVVALDNFGPGLKVLADNRQQLTAMLTSLSRLGDVGSRVIRASKDATIADLRSLQPILSRLAEAGTALPRSLELLLDYPFPKHSVSGIPGDYTTLWVTVDGNSLCNMVPLPGLPLPCAPTTGPGSGATTRTPGTTTQKPRPGLPTPLPSLKVPSAPVPAPTASLDTLLKGVLS